MNAQTHAPSPARIEMNQENSYKAFLSYVHEDDKREDGRIRQLADDLRGEYELLTGESIHLFVDHEAIEWGDDWSKSINASLADVAFFIPVITQNYFISKECRRELTVFAKRASDLGVTGLIMPVYYSSVREIEAEQPTDELAILAKQFQWADWRKLRLEERASKEYRLGVHELASRLQGASQAIEDATFEPSIQQLPSGPEQDPLTDLEEPGSLDLIAGAEEALPHWNETFREIADAIQEVGKITKEAADEVTSGNLPNNMASRLRILRRLAVRLRPPVDVIRDRGSQFTRQLHEIDAGVLELIRQGTEQPNAPEDQGEAIEQLFKSFRGIADSIATGFESMESLSAQVASVESMSRDIRPVLRKLRQGLRFMEEARDVSQRWITLMDSSPE